MGEVEELPEGVASNCTVKVPVWAGIAVFCQVVPEVKHCEATGLTTSVTVAVCVKLPLVPVMVSIGLPVVVELLAEMASVEAPQPITEPGLKVACAPARTPRALTV